MSQRNTSPTGSSIYYEESDNQNWYQSLRLHIVCLIVTSLVLLVSFAVWLYVFVFHLTAALKCPCSVSATPPPSAARSPANMNLEPATFAVPTCPPGSPSFHCTMCARPILCHVQWSSWNATCQHSCDRVSKTVDATTDECAALESVKAASDVYSPVSGVITEKNEAAEADPALINRSPYDQGWLLKIDLTNASEVDSLMDEKAYEEFVANSLDQ